MYGSSLLSLYTLTAIIHSRTAQFNDVGAACRCGSGVEQIIRND